MKKLLFLIAVMACFFAANAQNRVITSTTQFNIYGASTDTLKNTGTKSYTIAVIPFSKYARFYASVINKTGTSSVKVVLQGSYDNVYYKGVDSVTVTTAIPTLFGTTVSTYTPYLRFKLSGTGTQVSIPRIFVSIEIPK